MTAATTTEHTAPLLLADYDTLMGDLGDLHERDDERSEASDDDGIPKEWEWENARERTANLLDRFAGYVKGEAAPVRPAPEPDSLLGQHDSICADLAKLRERDAYEGDAYEALGEPSDEDWDNIRGEMEELLEQMADHIARTLYPFSCADCGTTSALTYVVTQLDHDDPSTRTESCRTCDDLTGPAAPADPADAKWTVIGIFDDQGEEIVTGVVYGHAERTDWASEYGTWTAHVRAEDAAEAAAVALADRKGE